MPFGQKSIELSTEEIVKVPNVIRMLIPESIIKQYLGYAVENNFKALGRSTMSRILSVCSASVRKYLQGLDYISSAGAQAFDDLSVVVDHLGDKFMGMEWAKDQKDRLKSAKRYLKSDFKVHVSKQTTVPDHRRKYSLSDPKDKDFQTKCDHNHFDSFDRCESLSLVLNEISGAMAKMSDNIVSVHTKEQLEFTVKKAKQHILAWKTHLLRNINQHH
ncbi:Hypothetical predicted protein [Paramuricea clavata]|uniref:Uncharacterized protein n=1 Tax=Paramuricea clavata TaxID=317549 RepID=A0A7D9JJB9_PARCT|nr:Hypothetical predicted protein [Paramuricea clavata]